MLRNDKMEIMKAEIRRILILQISAIGDALFAVPAIKALRKELPGAHISVLASRRAGSVLQNLPYLDDLRIFHGFFSLCRAIIQDRTMKYDLAVGLSNQGSWLAFLSGARFKAGFASPLLRSACPGSVKIKPSMHVVDYCLSVVGLLGAATSDREMEIQLTPQELEKADEFLKRHRLAGLPLVAIHPGGRYFPFKRWPTEQFARLADGLAQNGVGVILVGGPDDVELAARTAAAAKVQLASAIGELKLKETAALIGKCQLFVGNDSAPLHMAAAVKTPTISLYGPTDPAQFAPFGSGHSAIYKALPCSPCFKFLGPAGQHLPKCARPYCMEAIQADEVLALALAKLDLGRTAAMDGEDAV